MIHQLRSSASIQGLASSTPITVVYCIFYCLTLETRISKVCFLVYARDAFDAFTFLSSVNEGDRVAQLVIERIYTPEISEVDVSSLPSCPNPLVDPPLGPGGDYTW